VVEIIPDCPGSPSENEKRREPEFPPFLDDKKKSLSSDFL
jgi:hypothetical protein